MPFLEYDAEPILARTIGKTLHIVDDLKAAGSCDSIIVTIGTPVDEYLNPRLMPMLELAAELTPWVTSNHHIVLRSTVYPGTSERIYDFFRKQGVTPHFSFCPERIAQGYAVRELKRLPQIVSGFSETAVEKSEQLFAKLGLKTIRTTVKEAELAKLFLNSWRYIQFAAANQFYMMATEAGADFARLHKAMTTGYDRAQDFPGAGFAAGPCLLKDTMQLSAFCQNNFLLGHAGMLINEGMPGFVVHQIQQKRGDLKKETIGILGMAFKADVDDIRDSLSYKIGKLLRFNGATVLYSDEFAKDPTFISKEELVERSTVVIVGAPHSAYRTLKIPGRVHLVDIWGFFNRAE
jgi:UDP-N-acetyl-D-mannosaminuronic acid dehydrogenase